jgi:hypothetical protein
MVVGTYEAILAVECLHVPYWLRDLLSQFTFWATIRLSEVMLNDPRHFQLPN